MLVPIVAASGFVIYLIYSSMVLSNGNILLKEIRDFDFPILEMADENQDSYMGVMDALNSAATTGEAEFLNIAKGKASEILGSYATLKQLDTAQRIQCRFLSMSCRCHNWSITR